jgi:Tol biopolymer transport system component
VVLYELLTGERLFQGDEAADTLAQVLTKEPPLERVPSQVQRLLGECLQKDPKQRLRDIGDAKRLIDDQPQSGGPAALPRLAWIAAVMFAGITAAFAFIHYREVRPQQRTLRLSVPLPENMVANYLALSPDERQLALVLSREGKSEIYLRSLDSSKLQPLSGTSGVTTVGGPVFWSPDSRFIGFVAEGRLKVIPAAGGPAQVLCETGGVGAGTWNDKGVILFATDNGSLRRVSARGGECAAVGKQVGPESDARSFFPVFLPDGNHFFYVRRSQDQSSSGVYLATLDEPTGHRVLADYSNVAYVPPATGSARAHLVFHRENMLMDQRFDEGGLQPVGDPFPLATDAGPPTAFGMVPFGAAGGTLVYLAGYSALSQLTWYSRAGHELRRVGPQASQYGLTLSPDGNTVAVLRRDGDSGGPTSGLWMHDLTSGVDRRVTPPGTLIFNGIVWSPDSRSIWFTVGGGRQPRGIYQADREGGPPALIEELETVRTLADRNQRFLVYGEINPKTLSDIWYVPIDSGKPGKEAVELVGTDANERHGQISPDGKWLAYRVDEAGRPEVYVRPFPNGPGVWPVSGPDPAHDSNSFEPRWSADGKQLYFLTGTVPGPVTLMAAAVEANARGGSPVSSPKRLFEIRSPINLAANELWSYSPHPDGMRFLVNALVESQEPTINIFTNWQNAVAR